MWSLIFLAISFLAACTIGNDKLGDSNTQPTTFPLGSVHNCPATQLKDPTQPLLQMNVLPGLGFDDLRSTDLGRVYELSNFSTCQTSGDGIYLMPDAVNIIPIMHSKADLVAEVHDDTSQWKSETAYSINAAASVNWGVAHISSKFSMDYQTTRTKMVNDQSRSTRIGIHHRLYKVDVNPDSQLHPLFKSRIFDIAANVMNDNTKVAHYLSELLVRDYGTHVITGIDAGAILSHTTMFRGTYQRTGSSDHLAVSAAASASYLSRFKISVQTTDTSNNKDQESFASNSTSSFTTTHGGPPFKLGGTYEEWQAGILDHLVAVDRRGEPLHTILTTNNVPELPPLTLMEVSNFIEKAIVRYYKINTVSGCMTYAPLKGPPPDNFNFHANVDNHKCHKQQINYTFGGIYQTCENSNEHYEDVCKNMKLTQANPLTGDMSCPEGYTTVPLHKATYSAGVHKRKRFLRHTQYYPLEGTYSAFWCGLPPGQTADSGLLFGGIYTSKTPNIVTGKQSCPPAYTALRMAMDISVCVSSNTEEGYGESWNFGGFYSCSSGNPSAATTSQYSTGYYPKECPTHYNQLMMEVDEDCIINYCADIRKMLKFEPRPPRLPPFNNKVILSQNESAEVLLLTDIEGNTWAKTADGKWEKVVEPSTITTGQELLNEMQVINTSTVYTKPTSSNAQHRLNDGQIAGIVIGTAIGTLSIVAFVWIVGKGVKKHVSKKRTPSLATAAYKNIEMGNQEETIPDCQ